MIGLKAAKTTVRHLVHTCYRNHGSRSQVHRAPRSTHFCSQTPPDTSHQDESLITAKVLQSPPGTIHLLLSGTGADDSTVSQIQHTDTIA
jgi:hypothetical protein